MAKVATVPSISLNGLIAGRNDGPKRPPSEGGERIFAWYFGGDTDYEMPSGTMTFKVSPASAERLQELTRMAGALVAGRRTFDIANAWGGRHPVDVPTFVVTHSVPQEWAYQGSPFILVTDGVESDVEQAKVVAGDKNVAVGAASIVQQCIKAGLLDEVHIHLVPVLLGNGVRLFNHLGMEPIELERTRVIEAHGVTHLTLRVIK